jgi:hypothetical protein
MRMRLWPKNETHKEDMRVYLSIAIDTNTCRAANRYDYRYRYDSGSDYHYC